MAQSAEEFLASHELITLASASTSGEPHACDLLYVSDGTTIFFALNAGSQTAKNLTENPRASVSVGDAPDEGEDWTAARGIQLTGDVVDIVDEEERLCGEKFVERYPYLSDVFE